MYDYWKSIEETPPPKGETVLVAKSVPEFPTKDTCIWIATWDGEMKGDRPVMLIKCSDGYHLDLGYLTHWMPLPWLPHSIEYKSYPHIYISLLKEAISANTAGREVLAQFVENVLRHIREVNNRKTPNHPSLQ